MEFTCSHCQYGVAQGRSTFCWPHSQLWILVLGQGGHTPGWHISAHACRPHPNVWLHFDPHDHVLLLQRCNLGGWLPQKHSVLTILGHGGHGPETQRQNYICNGSMTSCEFFHYIQNSTFQRILSWYIKTQLIFLSLTNWKLKLTTGKILLVLYTSSTVSYIPSCLFWSKYYHHRMEIHITMPNSLTNCIFTNSKYHFIFLYLETISPISYIQQGVFIFTVFHCIR
jgi:hypothetical protein